MKRRRQPDAGPIQEKAFETAIEDHLITAGGYIKGDPKTYDAERGLFPQEVLAFIKGTQPKEWGYLENLQKDKAEETLLDDLCRALNSEHEGCLSVLRHGFKCFGKLFHVAYFAPASGMNPETQRLYEANRLTVTRQLQYSDQARELPRPGPEPQRHSGRHGRAQEPDDRPDLAATRSRSTRTTATRAT